MYACRLCHKLSNNSKLVRPGGADCFPTWIMDYINDPQRRHDDWNKDCLKIKKALRSTGKSRAKLMKMPSKDPKHGNYTYWMKMAFESVLLFIIKYFLAGVLGLQFNQKTRIKGSTPLYSLTSGLSLKFQVAR